MTAHDGLIILCPDPIGTRGRRVLAGCVFVGFFLLTAGIAIFDALWPHPPQKLIGLEAENDVKFHQFVSIRDGSKMRLWEYDLKRQSRIGKLILPFYATALYQALHITEHSTICGKDGWLFSRLRVSIADPHPANAPDRLAATLAAIDRRIGSFGTEATVIILVPRKEAAYAHLLPRGIDPTANFETRLHTAMIRHGLVALDVGALAIANLDMPFYKLKDTHWTSSAAALTMLEAAKVLGINLPPDKLKRMTIPWDWRTPGDLLRGSGMIGNDNWDPLVLSEWEHPVVVDDPAIKHHMSLEGDAPVAIVGTSFSTCAAIDAFIERATGMQVRNAGSPARGGIAPLNDLLFQSKHAGMPTYIFWEMPGHFLTEMHAIEKPFQVLLDQWPLRKSATPLTGGDGETFLQLLKGGPLKAGHHKFPEGWPWTLLPEGTLVHSANGMVGVRFQGTVRGGRVNAVAWANGESVTVHWEPGTCEVFVPAVSRGDASSEFTAQVESLEAGVELDLESAEVACDLDLSQKIPARPAEAGPAEGWWSQEIVFDPPVTVTRHAGVVMHVRTPNPGKGPCKVDAILDDGGARPLMNFSSLAADALIVVDLNAVWKRGVRAIRVSKEGALARLNIMDAFYAPLLKP